MSRRTRSGSKPGSSSSSPKSYKKKKPSPHAGTPRPDGELRQSQLLTTYGPGALVDLVHDAVLIQGLDWWGYDPRHVRSISEPRLRDAIARKLERLGQPRALRVEGAFRLPPATLEGHDAKQHSGHGVKARMFPAWMVCQNPTCRALVRSLSGLRRKGDHYLHDCTDKGSPCVPVRFVTACPRGHLDEFPWEFFVHGGRREGDEGAQRACGNPRLQLVESSSGDFAEIEVRCRTCGASRRMLDARLEDSYVECRGWRPWLGWKEAQESCPHKRRLLIRTASNAYFSQIESALTIPDPDTALDDLVAEHWETVKKASDVARFHFLCDMVDWLARVFEAYDAQAVCDAVARRHEAMAGGGEGGEEDAGGGELRRLEYRTFAASVAEGEGDGPGREDVFYARRLVPERPLPEGIGAVVLASKLREVRVQVGFTRLEPAVRHPSGEVDINARTAPLALTADWLPAVESFGEGIWVALDEARVQAWEARAAVRARAAELERAWDAHHTARLGELRDDPDVERRVPPFPGIRLHLIHTLAHALMTALALECGYAASALRERLYASAPGDPEPMAALLLMTTTPGSEGTLGGLVDQGRRLERHLDRALREALLCSGDPVCAMHAPGALTDRPFDGAACHSCLYVAECSCEIYNQHLDRALLVPVMGQDPALAFFAPASPARAAQTPQPK